MGRGERRAFRAAVVDPCIGFRYGYATAEVEVAALAALANANQSADIARTELANYADLVRARYLVQIETGT